MRLRLGYDIYSIRAYKWNAFQHLDFAAQQKIDAIQFSELNAFESLEPDYLVRVKRRAQDLGIKVDVGIGCICQLSKSWNGKSGSPEKVLTQGIEVARVLGAGALRCVMGTDKDRTGNLPLSQLMDATAANLKRVRSKALDAGVTIAIENHKDMQARQVRQLIEESGRDFVGSNLDLGNPLTLMEHPMTTLEVLGPYTVTSHFRDSAVYETRDGAAAQWTAMGDGSINFKEIVAKFGELCPRASVHLEIITGRPPYRLPYLNEAYWKNYEGMPAHDFARFVALAKSGQPFTGRMVIEDEEGKAPAPEFKSALEFQQLNDLKRSLKYCKEVLDLGPQT